MKRESEFEWWDDFWHWTHHANWDSISLFATGAGTLILALGVGLALVSLWDSRRTRDGELVLELSRRWNEPETVASRRAFSEKKPAEVVALVNKLYPATATGETASPAAASSEDDLKTFQLLQRWPSLIETIGVLHDHGAISTDAIFKMWGYSIAFAWENWQDTVKILRERAAFPGTFEYFEKIAKLMQKQAGKRLKKLAKQAAKESRAGR